MTNRSEFLDMVVAELRTALDLDDSPIGESDVLRELPGADSVRLFRAAAALERRAGTEFADEDLFGAKTVGDLVDLVAGRVRT